MSSTVERDEAEAHLRRLAGDAARLRDDQWARIEGMLPGKVGDRGRSAKDNRRFVEAVLWIARTGSPWRDLPEEFGLWNSVFRRFARWSDAGVWARVFATLAQDADFEEVK